ncbi:short-chain dehydrogenase, partial [Mycobacterium sp. ITM-2017-0098]
ADALIDACVREFGRIDILVNCAGTAEPVGSSILNVTTEQFQNPMDAHLGTAFQTCRAAAPLMVQQGSGAIVNTSSFAFLGDYGGT